MSISGYSFVRNDLKGDQHGGGTLTYIKDGIPYRTRTDLLTTEMESCLIELTCPNCKRLFIFTVYRPPDQVLDSFIGALNGSLSAMPTYAEILLLGDFIVNYLAKKSDPSHLMKQKPIRIADAYNFEQIIDQPTRITENSSTAIDLLLANNNHRIVDSGVLHVHLSDHSLIYCVVISKQVSQGPQHKLLSTGHINIIQKSNLSKISKKPTGTSSMKS